MIARVLTGLWAALFVLVLGLSAQAQTAIDYDAWAGVSDRANSVLESGGASDDALEALRKELADWRANFLKAQSDNQSRVATLESQIEALGPVPESGEEPELIVKRRAELSEQLAKLKAPIQRAEEAYTEANGLIGEIDSAIRERQADKLLELGPTPLSPTHWPGAVEDLAAALLAGFDEVRQAWSSEVQRAKLRNNLPLIVMLLALAGILVMRGRTWGDRLATRFRHGARRGMGVWSLLVSLGQILLPLLGLVAVVAAAEATGMFGPRTRPFVEAIPAIGALLLFVRWLADQSFARDEKMAAIALPAFQRAEARTYFNILSILLVLRSSVALLDQHAEFSPQTLAVLDFPILAGCALILFRLGLILSSIAGAHRAEQTEDGSAPDSILFRNRLLRLLGRVVMLIAVGGTVMSAVGYGNAGTSLIYPAVLSLFVASVVMVLQRLLNDVYEMATGRSSKEGDSLFPVLGGFVLILASMPVLALIWGARRADLTELWARFLEGVQLGETRVSPSDFLTLILVFAAGYGLTRVAQGALRNTVLPKTRLDPGVRNAVVSGVGYLGIFLAALIAITATGLDLSSLAIVAGALSVGIGFGLQNIVQNFVAGIILLIERPISEGDWIEVGGQQGIVKDISVRSTRIETFDRTDVIVPNGDFVSGTVTNYTRGNSIGRVTISVGVAYGTDTRKVEEILSRIVRENDYVLTNPEPLVSFVRFGADALEFEVRAVLRDVFKKMIVLSDVNHEIARRFAEEGIEIPYAQRDIWLRNPEALATALQPPRRAPEHHAATASAQARPAPSVPLDPDDGDGEGETL
ncbi:MAG: mechanosensitive ion channel family protein [Roseivivax sp.]|nr:mechanosensitive ion channel family protein [Roseivivax sp.]